MTEKTTTTNESGDEEALNSHALAYLANIMAACSSELQLAAAIIALKERGEESESMVARLVKAGRSPMLDLGSVRASVMERIDGSLKILRALQKDIGPWVATLEEAQLMRAHAGAVPED